MTRETTLLPMSRDWIMMMIACSECLLGMVLEDQTVSRKERLVVFVSRYQLDSHSGCYVLAFTFLAATCEQKAEWASGMAQVLESRVGLRRSNVGRARTAKNGDKKWI